MLPPNAGDWEKNLPRPCSAQDLARFLGAPDKLDVLADGAEVWSYRGSLNWVGAVVTPIIPLPLPLLAPLVREERDFTVREGNIESITVKTVGHRYIGYLIVLPGIMHSSSGPDYEQMPAPLYGIEVKCIGKATWIPTAAFCQSYSGICF